MLDALSLTKYYDHTSAVRDVSFTIKPGEILGYLGVKRRRQKHHGKDADRADPPVPQGGFGCISGGSLPAAEPTRASR